MSPPPPSWTSPSADENPFPFMRQKNHQRNTKPFRICIQNSNLCSSVITGAARAATICLGRRRREESQTIHPPITMNLLTPNATGIKLALESIISGNARHSRKTVFPLSVFIRVHLWLKNCALLFRTPANSLPNQNYQTNPFQKNGFPYKPRRYFTRFPKWQPKRTQYPSPK